MARVILGFLLTLLVIAGVIFLQVYLSRRESRWPGLVLPIISFVLSLLLVLGNWMFTAVKSGPVTTDESGTQVVQQEEQQAEHQAGSTSSSLIVVALLLPLANIPTVVLAVIYASEREKFRKKRQRAKMDIQDLE